MKSIWEKIKLTFGRQPKAEILLPPKELNTKVEVVVTVPEQTKTKRTRKKSDAKEV